MPAVARRTVGHMNLTGLLLMAVIRINIEVESPARYPISFTQGHRAVTSRTRRFSETRGTNGRPKIRHGQNPMLTVTVRAYGCVRLATFGKLPMNARFVILPFAAMAHSASIRKMGSANG